MRPALTSLAGRARSTATATGAWLRPLVATVSARVRPVVERVGPPVVRSVAAARSVLEPAARRAWPVLAVVRPAGWALAGVGIVSWWLGRTYGWQELVVVALASALLLLAAVVFVVGRSEYKIVLDLTRRRVVVGERAVGRVEVSNTSAHALLPAEVELPVGEALAAFGLPRLAPHASHEDLFMVPTTRRAVIKVGPVRSVRGDALGLMRRQKDWTEHVELFVHPRTVPLHGASSGFLKDLEGRPTKDLSSSDVSFHALREYAPGDDLRHVHWKTSARTGTLMVRQFEETRRSHLAVVLSTNAADYDDPEEFELAISVAGSLAVQALREERDVTILVQGSALRGVTPSRVLDDLTRLQLRVQRPRIPELAREVGEQIPDASVAVLLFGTTVSPSLMHLAGTRLPIDVHSLAVQSVPGAKVSRRAVADLTTLALGDLADLAGAMRRVAS